MRFLRRGAAGGTMLLALGCASLLTPSDPELEKRQDNLYQRGLNEYKKERYEEALGYWKQAYDLSPYTEPGKKSKEKMAETERIVKRLREIQKTAPKPG